MIKALYVLGRILADEKPYIGSLIEVEEWGTAKVLSIRYANNDHHIELQWQQENGEEDYTNEYLFSIKQGFRN